MCADSRAHIAEYVPEGECYLRCEYEGVHIRCKVHYEAMLRFMAEVDANDKRLFEALDRTQSDGPVQRVDHEALQQMRETDNRLLEGGADYA